jgi:hypothetical protein
MEDSTKARNAVLITNKRPCLPFATRKWTLLLLQLLGRGMISESWVSVDFWLPYKPIAPSRSPNHFSKRLSSCLWLDFKDNDRECGDEENSYFEDFDFIIGGGENHEDMSLNSNKRNNEILRDRMQEIVGSEQATRQQIADNWREGYWNVWGCSLDPFVVDDSTSDDNIRKTVVTCLCLASKCSDNNDCEDDDSVVLIVGRSDGSLVWLQMDVTPSFISLSDKNHPSVHDRSIVTYFENKLTAKATSDGGIMVGSALQRSDPILDKNEKSDGISSTKVPFDILAQIATGCSAIVDMLVLPRALMLWTIHQDTPHLIQVWNLSSHEETGFLLPSTTQQPTSVTLDAMHTSSIIAMKPIPGQDDNLVVTISKDGQVVVWDIGASEIGVAVRFEGNLLAQEPMTDSGDSLLSMDIDDQYLCLGSKMGYIFVYSIESMLHGSDEIPSPAVLVKQFVGFNNREPGVSALCLSVPDASLHNKQMSTPARLPTKTLIAGNVLGALKQWELIRTRNGDGLEYWPRMPSQRLPGKVHVFDTTGVPLPDDDAPSPAIQKLLVIQHVILAATDHDLKVWDPITGKSLYDMQGLDFSTGHLIPRPCLVSVQDSVLVTNGMDQYICVHDFAMERVTSENAQDMMEREDQDII